MTSVPHNPFIPPPVLTDEERERRVWELYLRWVEILQDETERAKAKAEILRDDQDEWGMAKAAAAANS